MPAPEHLSDGMHSAGTTLYVGAWTLGPPGAIPIAPQTPFAAGVLLGKATWVALPELTDGDGAGVKPSVTKLTHLRSPGKALEKVPGFKDGNQWSAKFNYTADLMVALQNLVPGSAIAGGTNPDTADNYFGRKAWLVELPDRGLVYFKGFLADDPIEVPEDDGIKLSLTIEITGRPVKYKV